MSTVLMLKEVINERLNVAVEEIFGVFEKTIEEYEVEVSRSKEEIERQRRLLDLFLKPKRKRYRSDPPQLCEVEFAPELQEWIPSLDQKDPEPPKIKEEQEELMTNQEREQLQGLDEAGIYKLILSTVKSEDDQEKTQCSQPIQTQIDENTEADPLPRTSGEPYREDGGESQPISNLDSTSDLEPINDNQYLPPDYCETETEDRDDDWKETRRRQSGSNTLKSKKTEYMEGQSLCISNELRRSKEPSYELKRSNQSPSAPCCQVCGKYFSGSHFLMQHIKIHLKDCGLCGKHLEDTESMKLHLKVHSTCDVSGKRVTSICTSRLENGVTIHTGERCFSCKDCGKAFRKKHHLDRHIRSHTGEKPFCCSVCGRTFGEKAYLKMHVKVHSGEKPFSCIVCGKAFAYKEYLKVHMRIHTGEKPYICTVCGKGFSQNPTLIRHMRLHTGQKPLSDM